MTQDSYTSSDSDHSIEQSAAAWDDRYKRGVQGWDLGVPSPVVSKLAAAWLPPASRVLVPGCGLGHEVRALADMGHHPIGVDFAPLAITHAALASEGTSAKYVVCNVLNMPRFNVDAVVEHNCMCSLPPCMWPRYAACLAAQLGKGGILLGSFLCFDNTSGTPPHGIAPEQLLSLFIRQFNVEHIAEASEYFPPSFAKLAQGVLRVPQLELVLRRR